MPNPDPLADFRTALERYQECRGEFVRVDKVWEPDGEIKTRFPDWIKADTARAVAAEGLWVSGLAGFFSLLEVNYKAQERLVAEQLKLAEKSSEAADKVAWWTKALVMVTAILILTTAAVGLFGPVFARAPAPIEVRLMAPGLTNQAQAPSVSPADPRSPQSPTHDR